MNDTSLVLRDHGRRSLVQLASARDPERSIGHRRLQRGAVGFLIGASSGAALGAITGNQDAQDHIHEDFSGLIRLYGPIIGAVLGGVAGTVVGVATAPERWEPLTHIP